MSSNNLKILIEHMMCLKYKEAAAGKEALPTTLKRLQETMWGTTNILVVIRKWTCSARDFLALAWMVSTLCWERRANVIFVIASPWKPFHTLNSKIINLTWKEWVSPITSNTICLCLLGCIEKVRHGVFIPRCIDKWAMPTSGYIDKRARSATTESDYNAKWVRVLAP